ncbi:unnamed protein product [Choristocarpus tenellus]
MPWAAIPFSDNARRDSLKRMFGVRGIPALVTIGADGNVINQAARAMVSEDPKGLNFPWSPKPVVDLATGLQSNGYELQQKASLIVFMEGADDLDQKEASTDLDIQ